MKKLLFLLVFLLSYTALSQSLSVFDIDASGFPTIKAKFFAFDANGDQITNLIPSDFSVTENGQPRTITLVSCPAPKPPLAISSVLTIDVSGSMSGQRIEYAKAAGRAWVEGLPLGKSECAITTFNSSNFYNQDFTTNRNKLLNAIDKLSAGGGTDFDAGFINPMAGALLAVEKGKHKKVVVFLTDGRASGNEAAIIQKANQINATVYCVTLDIPCPQILKNIAAQTGGLWFENVMTADHARQIYLQILQTAQGGDPCEIEWESRIRCKSGQTNVGIKLNSFNLTSNLSYQLPSNTVARLKFNPSFVYFRDKTPGIKHDTTIIVTAYNADFNVSEIIISNPAFQISPSSFFLKAGESTTMTLSFTPPDSGHTNVQIEFVNSHCPIKYFAIGGFRGKKPIVKTLKLTHPNGGEVFVVGSDTLINWEGIAPESTVKLEYSIDKGQTWELLSDEATGLRYEWKNIPKPPSDQCLVSIKQLGYSVGSDTIPQIQWQKTLGGSDREYANSIWQTNDGSYIVAGFTLSSDGDVTGWKGYDDYWIVKLDVSGNLQWQKTLGGSNYEHANSIQQTYDGGFVVAGRTSSNDGDVTGNRGGYFDYWIVKLDVSGNLQWQKTLGGSSLDIANSIRQTFDGGFIMAGTTSSSDGDVTENKGKKDFWIVKLDDMGDLQWQKTFGGSSLDIANSIRQTFDGGYIIAGQTSSTDGDVTGNKGDSDFWVVKLDYTGNLQWQKTLGGSSLDIANSIRQTNDSGYVIAGQTSSTDGDVTGNKGGYSDFWVVKLDDTGNIEWQKTLGGSSMDDANSIQQTIDGGYAVAGFTFSNDGDVTGNKGESDYWIVKLSPEGYPLQEDVSDAVFSIVEPEVASTDIDMGQVLVGDAKDSVVIKFVSNIGSWPFRVDSIYFQGADASAFRMVSGFPKYVVDAGLFHHAEFSFSPTEVRIYQAKIVIITQADTLIQNITGEGVEQKLQVFSDVIDFGTLEIGDYKDITKILLTNISDDDITITSTVNLGPDTDQFEIISGGGSFTLASNGDTRELTLRFAPRYIGRTSGQIGFYFDGPGSPATALLFGTGIGGMVYVDDDSAYAGERRMIPILLGNASSEKLQQVVESFRGILRVQQFLLAPTDPGQLLKIENDSTFVSFSGKIDGTSNILANVAFIAGLGNVQETSIDIVEFNWYDKNGDIVDYDTEVQSGTFKLLGICPEGGDRLLNPKGEAGMMTIIPNPANESIEIRFNLIEKGTTKLIVTDLLGETIDTIYESRQGVGQQVINYNINDLTSGTYYMILQTPTIINTQKFEVIR